MGLRYMRVLRLCSAPLFYASSPLSAFHLRLSPFLSRSSYKERVHSSPYKNNAKIGKAHGGLRLRPAREDTDEMIQTTATGSRRHTYRDHRYNGNRQPETHLQSSSLLHKHRSSVLYTHGSSSDTSSLHLLLIPSCATVPNRHWACAIGRKSSIIGRKRSVIEPQPVGSSSETRRTLSRPRTPPNKCASSLA